MRSGTWKEDWVLITMHVSRGLRIGIVFLLTLCLSMFGLSPCFAYEGRRGTHFSSSPYVAQADKADGLVVEDIEVNVAFYFTVDMSIDFYHPDQSVRPLGVLITFPDFVDDAARYRCFISNYLTPTGVLVGRNSGQEVGGTMRVEWPSSDSVDMAIFLSLPQDLRWSLGLYPPLLEAICKALRGWFVDVDYEGRDHNYDWLPEVGWGGVAASSSDGLAKDIKVYVDEPLFVFPEQRENVSQWRVVPWSARKSLPGEYLKRFDNSTRNYGRYWVAGYAVRPIVENLERMARGEIYVEPGDLFEGVRYSVTQLASLDGVKRWGIRILASGGFAFCGQSRNSSGILSDEKAVKFVSGAVPDTSSGVSFPLSIPLVGVDVSAFLSVLGPGATFPLTKDKVRFYIEGLTGGGASVILSPDLGLEIYRGGMGADAPHITQILDGYGRDIGASSCISLSQCGGRITILGAGFQNSDFISSHPQYRDTFKVVFSSPPFPPSGEHVPPQFVTEVEVGFDNLGVSWKDDSIVVDYWVFQKLLPYLRRYSLGTLVKVQGVKVLPGVSPETYSFFEAVSPSALTESVLSSSGGDCPSPSWNPGWSARIGAYGDGSDEVNRYVLWVEGVQPGENCFGAFPDSSCSFEVVFVPNPQSEGHLRSFVYEGRGDDDPSRLVEVTNVENWPPGRDTLDIYHSQSRIWFFWSGEGLAKEFGPWTVILRFYKNRTLVWETTCVDKITGDFAQDARVTGAYDFSGRRMLPGSWRWDPNKPTLPPTWADFQVYVALKEPPVKSYSSSASREKEAYEWYSITMIEIWNAMLDGKVNLRLDGDGTTKVHPIMADQLKGLSPEAIMLFFEALIRTRSYYYAIGDGKSRINDNQIYKIYEEWDKNFVNKASQDQVNPEWYESLPSEARIFFDGGDIGQSKEQILKDNFLLEGHAYGGADWESGETNGKEGLICFSNPTKGKTEYMKFTDILNALSRDPRSIGSRLWGFVKGAVSVVLSPLALVGDIIGGIAKNLLWWVVAPIIDSIFTYTEGSGNPSDSFANIFNPNPTKILMKSPNNALGVFLGRILPGLLALVIFLMGVGLILGSFTESYGMRYELRTVIPRLIIGIFLVVFFYLPCNWLWGLNEWLCRAAYDGFGAGAETVFTATMKTAGRLLAVSFGTVGFILVIVFGVIFVIIGVLY
ncbi:MAG: hypothetical protein QXH08_00160, partial [Candidatus Hadarchaeales archaeon]